MASNHRWNDQRTLMAVIHSVSVELLRESFYELKRQSAPGVDGMTWAEYEQGLEDRLVDLHSRVHRGSYRAQASKRTWIPKPDGKQRPLGVASLEDNINHEWLMQFIEHRIADKRILRLIRK